MTFSPINPKALDGIPEQVRSSIMDFVGCTNDYALKATCRTFALTPSSEVNPDLLPIDKVVERIMSSSPKEIETYVQSKFENLRKSGILLYRSEFETRENPARFRTPADQDLSRLWGAEYLRKKLAHRDEYRVPRFVLVIDDPIKILTINLWCITPKRLCISTIETPNVKLLVENIDPSVPVARDPSHRWMTSIGFVDYSDPGNILKGENGHYYVVDTEWKSLEGCQYKGGNRKIIELRDYTKKRFRAFNPWISKSINIKINK